MTLNNIQKIHFVGIKGVAMAALAYFVKQKGINVTGSDVSDQFPTDAILSKEGISVLTDFKAAHIDETKPDMVIYTGAHNGRDNCEVERAVKLSIPVYPHGKALGLFMSDYRQMSVAGSHGKTTTSAMIATVMANAGLDPSYAVGCGDICGLGIPGHYGRGKWFIAEADEYMTDPGHDHTPRFLWQSPEILVITNIDYDHPDVYKNLHAVQQAFIGFTDKIRPNGTLIINSDDESSKILNTNNHIIRIGFAPECDFRIEGISYQNQSTQVHLKVNHKTDYSLKLNVPGKHNVYNAVLAAAAAYTSGVTWEDISAGLQKFCGSKRRFEQIARIYGTTFFDDYAHHPREIRATLEAVRTWFPKTKVLTVFQPHTYSRTMSLKTQFSHAFKDSDVVIFLDIYASAREKNTFDIDSQRLADETSKFHQHIYYAQNIAVLTGIIRKKLKLTDIVIFMGAGDVYTIGLQVIKNLTNS